MRYQRYHSLVALLLLAAPAGLTAQATDTAKSRRSKVATGAKTGAVSGAAAAAAAFASPTSAAALEASSPSSAIPTCAPGQVLYAAPVAPTAAAAGSNSLMSTAMGVMAPGGTSMIDAAKKKYLKKDSSAVGAVGAGAVAGAATGAVNAAAGSPQYLCGTPDQAVASMQASNQAAQAGQAGAPSVGSMLAATPQGMMVNGAIAAAPIAMAGAKKVGGMFFKGQTKESMAADLARGKLVMKGLKFVEGTDMLVADAENDIPLLGEALKFVEGQFILTVPAETDGKSPPDVALAKRRVARIAIHLLTSGIGEDRVTARPFTPPAPDAKPATVKPGAARPELARVPTEPKP